MKGSESGLTAKIRSNQPQVIYGLLLIFIIVPILYPIAVPMAVTEDTKKLYDFVEKLRDGSLVVVDGGVTVGWWPEMQPGAAAISQHLFNRPVRIIFIAFIEDTSILLHQMLTGPLIDKKGKKYGVDYVELGFMAGGEAGMAAFARDFHAVLKSDYYGEPIDTLPIMKDAVNAKSLALWIPLGGWEVEWALRQVGPHGTPIGCVSLAGNVPGFKPFLATGQLVGLLNSVKGGAEYEILMKKPGLGAVYMGGISLSHIVTIALVILGNVIYFVSRGKVKKEK